MSEACLVHEEIWQIPLDRTRTPSSNPLRGDIVIVLGLPGLLRNMPLRTCSAATAMGIELREVQFNTLADPPSKTRSVTYRLYRSGVLLVIIEQLRPGGPAVRRVFRRLSAVQLRDFVPIRTRKIFSPPDFRAYTSSTSAGCGQCCTTCCRVDRNGDLGMVCLACIAPFRQ